MRKALIATALLALCGLLLAAESPVAGIWKVVSTGPGPGDEFVWKMTIKDTEGKLSGTLAGDMGEFQLSEVKFENDVLSGKLTIDTETYVVEMKMQGNTGEGKWKGGGGEGGTLKATKE